MVTVDGTGNKCLFVLLLVSILWKTYFSEKSVDWNTNCHIKHDNLESRILLYLILGNRRISECKRCFGTLNKTNLAILLILAEDIELNPVQGVSVFPARTWLSKGYFNKMGRFAKRLESSFGKLGNKEQVNRIPNSGVYWLECKADCSFCNFVVLNGHSSVKAFSVTVVICWSINMHTSRRYEMQLNQTNKQKTTDTYIWVFQLLDSIFDKQLNLEVQNLELLSGK